MLRRLATLYGARPGTLSLLKLARMVVTHIVLTGGIALGDDVIQQVIGHGLTAKLSARLGEGMFNGALTTRIGLAAIDVCRPLPYIEVPAAALSRAGRRGRRRALKLAHQQRQPSTATCSDWPSLNFSVTVTLSAQVRPPALTRNPVLASLDTCACGITAGVLNS